MGLTRNTVVGVVFRARFAGVDIDPHGYHRKLNGGGAKKFVPTGLKPPKPRTETETLMARLPAETKHEKKLKQKATEKTPGLAELSPPQNAVVPPKVLFPAVVRPTAKRGVVLVRTHPNGCKYPVGEKNGRHLFCNAPAKRASLCEEHYSRCYTRPTKNTIKERINTWLK